MKLTSNRMKPLRFDTLDTGCFVCVSHKRNSGGHVRYQNPRTNSLDYLHRVVHELRNGPIPEGLFVCHTCDVPSCCNPEHLFLGDNRDNIIDMYKKGRKPKSERKLTAEDVSEIKRRLPNERHQDIADDYGVSVKTIGHINTGQTWKHVEPKQSNRTSHLPVPDDGDSINHQPHHTGREPYCGPVQLTIDFLQ